MATVARMTISDTQRALLASDRWSWLGGFVDRWYAAPLTAADGCTPEDITAAAQRVGTDLPTGVAEWFALVGHRLEAVQDAPATLDTLAADAGGVVVWVENQEVWTLVARADGMCTLGEDEEDFQFPPTPLPQALHGILLSDTLVGAWSGTQLGPLGRLAPGVRGGFVQQADAEVAAAVAAYPDLDLPGNPFWGVPPRGDDETVLRGDESFEGLEWMTASAAAFDRLTKVIELDPPGGPQEVVIAFEDLTPADRAALVDDRGVPDMDRFGTAVDDFGHLSQASSTAAGIRFHVSTQRPDETVAALRGVIPAELDGKVVVAVRPERISGFRVVHPAGRAEYVLPPMT